MREENPDKAVGYWLGLFLSGMWIVPALIAFALALLNSRSSLPAAITGGSGKAMLLAFQIALVIAIGGWLTFVFRGDSLTAGLGIVATILVLLVSNTVLLLPWIAVLILLRLLYQKARGAGFSRVNG